MHERFHGRVPAVVTGTLMLGLGLLAPLLPELRERWALSGLELGLLVAAFPAGRLLFAYLGGAASDRFGYRRVGLVACIGAASAAVTGALFFQPLALGATQFVIGAGSACYASSAATHVLQTARTGRAGRAMSTHQTVSMVGGALGPLLGGVAATRIGLPAPLVLYAALAAAGAVLTVRFVPRTVAAPVVTVVEEDVIGTPARARRRVFGLLALAAVALFWARTGPVTTLVPILGSDRLGLDAELIGLALTAGIGTTVVVLAHAGRLADAGRSRLMMVVVSVPLGACLALVGLVTDGVQLFIVLAAFGALSGYLLTAPQVLLLQWSAPGRRGRAVGGHRSAASLGMVLGPLTSGAAVGSGLVSTTFVVGGALLAVVGLAMLALPVGTAD